MGNSQQRSVMSCYSLEQCIEDPLSEELLRGTFAGKDTIVVSAILESE